MEKKQAYVIVSGMGDVYLRADNSWTRDRSEAERFYNPTAAFFRSAERHGRYVEPLPAHEAEELPVEREEYEAASARLAEGRL
jgi:hypothetical protein